MDDTAFAVTTLENETIAFLLTDVQSVEFYDDLSAFDRGTLVSGTENSSCYSGTYTNTTLGEYQLHVNLATNCYLVICYSDGVLVCNTTSADGTSQLYTDLLSALTES